MNVPNVEVVLDNIFFQIVLALMVMEIMEVSIVSNVYLSVLIVIIKRSAQLVKELENKVFYAINVKILIISIQLRMIVSHVMEYAQNVLEVDHVLIV